MPANTNVYVAVLVTDNLYICERKLDVVNCSISHTEEDCIDRMKRLGYDETNFRVTKKTLAPREKIMKNMKNKKEA